MRCAALLQRRLPANSVHAGSLALRHIDGRTGGAALSHLCWPPQRSPARGLRIDAYCGGRSRLRHGTCGAGVDSAGLSNLRCVCRHSLGAVHRTGTRVIGTAVPPRSCAQTQLAASTPAACSTAHRSPISEGFVWHQGARAEQHSDAAVRVVRGPCMTAGSGKPGSRQALADARRRTRQLSEWLCGTHARSNHHTHASPHTPPAVTRLPLAQQTCTQSPARSPRAGRCSGWRCTPCWNRACHAGCAGALHEPALDPAGHTAVETAQPG